MAEAAPRRILHVDMDAFFAAIELRRHPELKGKPVVIGGSGRRGERSVVSTASYEARPFGIRSGMPLTLAHRWCPQAVFLPVDYATYAAESVRIKRLLAEFSPVVEDAGIDEAFLDLTAVAGDSETVARAIKRRILEETGLTCSAGIGPNKLLAKLASDMQKPDGLTVLAAADVASRVWPLPARKLPGVGPKTGARLAALGVHTIGALAHTPVETLVAHFGPAHGGYLHDAAQGIDDSPLVTHWEPKSASHETTFPRDIGDAALLRRRLGELAREVAEGLAEEGYVGDHVTVKLRYEDFDTHTHAVALAAPTRDAETIRAAALECFARFPLDRRVRLLGVRVGGLTRT